MNDDVIGNNISNSVNTIICVDLQYKLIINSSNNLSVKFRTNLRDSLRTDLAINLWGNLGRNIAADLYNNLKEMIHA